MSLTIRTTIELNMMMNNPAHAGGLVSEWLDGLKEEDQAITITELVEHIQLTRPLLSRIINGKAPVTADEALLVVRYYLLKKYLFVDCQIIRDIHYRLKVFRF